MYFTRTLSVIIAIFFLSGCGMKYSDLSVHGTVEDLQKEVKTIKEKQEALSWVVMAGRIDMAEYLIKEGADVNYDPDHMLIQPPGYPALCNAIEAKQLEMVKFLIQNGADVNQACDNQRGYPVGYAARIGDVKIIKYLVQNGADIYLPNFPQNFEIGTKTTVEILENSGYGNLANELITLQNQRHKESAVIQENQKKKESKTQMQKKVDAFLLANDLEGLKKYTESEPNAVYYIPNVELRLMLTGPQGLKIGDVVKMVEQERSEKIILAMIRAVKTPYKEFSIEEIDILLKMGLNDTIVAMMIDVSTELFKDMRRKEEQEKFLKEQAKISQQKQFVPQMQLQQKGAADVITEEVTKQGVKMLLDHLF